MEQNKKPMLPWTVAKSFEQDNVYVEVQKLALARPKYSLVIGSINKEGKRQRFVNVTWAALGDVSLGVEIGDIIALLNQAGEFIREELRVVEDARIAAMQSKETRHDAPVTEKKRYTGPRDINRVKR